jgi:hypothetical protein
MQTTPRNVLVCLPVLLVSIGVLASAPVHHKSTGCVIQGRAYSIHDARTVYRYRLPGDYVLTPYEGKKVVLEGQLLPGDMFRPAKPTLQVLGRCDARTRKLIAEDR